jgi:NhaA family Na+:H+ antiporter
MSPDKIIDQLSSPFTRYTNTEALSGMVLIFCALAALIWSNSATGETYEALWHTHLSLGVGDFRIDKPLHIWINDGLMALFFFYVGLEIKHEVKVGELSDFKHAALPFFAAIGGMVIPATFFLITYPGPGGSSGWGIPMATDIAFALGILMLLGDRVPNSMKVFLTAFAIVDDIGAVAVIAIFYSQGIQWGFILLSLGALGLLLILKWINLRNATVYFLFGVVIWYFVLQSGIHPTVAGIAVALLIPTNNRIRMRTFVAETRSSVQEFLDAKANAQKQFLAKRQLNAISEIEDYVDMVQPPLQKLEHHLHAYVAFVIMPIFALSNAGVHLRPEAGLLSDPLSWSIIAGLLLGKVIGITLFSWLGIKLGLARLPEHTSWIQLIGLGFLGGIGFTMALFIANLAFGGSPDLLSPAKIGILIGSTLSGAIGYVILSRTLPPKPPNTSRPESF